MRQKDRSKRPIDEFIVRHCAEDYELMYELFKELGYDITKNIHNQFCERHNLIPDTRKKVNRSKANLVQKKPNLTQEQIDWIQNLYIPRDKDYGLVAMSKIFDVSIYYIAKIIKERDNILI